MVDQPRRRARRDVSARPIHHQHASFDLQFQCRLREVRGWDDNGSLASYDGLGVQNALGTCEIQRVWGQHTFTRTVPGQSGSQNWAVNRFTRLLAIVVDLVSGRILSGNVTRTEGRS